MENLTIDDINDNIAIIKINKSYREAMSPLELYDRTRGCWKRKIESVEHAEYVLSVVFGEVKEVYKVDRWAPAKELNRETRPYNPETDTDRIGFLGKIAEESIRSKYIGKSVALLYKQGEADPVKVILRKGEGIRASGLEWWPRKEEYDPGITVEQWIGVLRNQEVTSDKTLRMFTMMMDYGKPASCSELAEKYGETKNFFSKGSSSYAEKVAKYTKCNIPPQRINENARWWPILYVGRDAEKEERGSYIWKFREELKEALEKIKMKDAWLVTWNPTHWKWKDYYTWCEETRKGKVFTEAWTCSSKKPALGDDVFLMKSGDKPRGIIAHGIVGRESYLAPHYDEDRAIRGDESGHIDIVFDRILNYENEDFLLQDSLKEDMPQQLWSPMASGIEIKKEILPELWKRWKQVAGEGGKKEMKDMIGKNTILYGPPGTGKTYSTVKYAVSICDPAYASAHPDYSDLLVRYNELKSEGRISFTTFHQSYGYEEFIEGIKPVVDDEGTGESGVEYAIESGLFKKFCERASLPALKNKTDYGFNEDPTVWKVSLYKSFDNPVRDECLRNGHIRIGWDDYGQDITDVTKYEIGGRVQLNAFIYRMREGDIVFSCYSQSTIDAIGVITGEYEWDDSFSEYKRVRKVKWILKKKIDIRKINNGRNMVQPTVYRMSITAADVIRLLNDELPTDDVMGDIIQADKYVFIIDEINRGNISKIFGELITLIEDGKRIGDPEEVRVVLPYSHTSFGVPGNVYILGTMNTADRSIALMDTALRRRFNFIEMMPDVEVIKGITVSDSGETLDVAKMLEAINRRIEYLYDREHTIGHAFFTVLKGSSATLENLAIVFKNKIIPLLQEYFYDDYEKIQLVLGDNDKSSDVYKFILDTKVNENEIFKKSPQLDLREKTYIIQDKAFNSISSYIEIYEDRKSGE